MKYQFIKIVTLGLLLIVASAAFCVGCIKQKECTEKPNTVSIETEGFLQEPSDTVSEESDSEISEESDATEFVESTQQVSEDSIVTSETSDLIRFPAGIVELTPVEPKPEVSFVAIDELYETDRHLKLYGLAEYDDNTKALEELLNSYTKSISLVCWSVDGTKAISYNSQQTYNAGCTIKMPYFLYCCTEMDNDNDSPDNTMVYEERHWHGGSGQIRYAAYGTEYTLKELVTLGLSISDNVAYEMLWERFNKYHDYNDFIGEKGCESLKLSGMWPSRVKASDFVRIWNEVYNYLNSDAPNAEMLRNACTNTVFAYGMKKINDVEYSHKSGHQYEPWPGYNDAGIIYAKTPYIYAIFTSSEGTDYDQDTIADAMQLAHRIMS